MADKTLNGRIQTKIDTASNWQKSTTPLLEGELAIDSTNHELRYGDGSNTFQNSKVLGVTVDDKLDGNSTNPVQNKVVNSALGGKSDTGHKHTKSEITDFPTSMPASDVQAWAKAANKPTYNATEVGAIPASAKGAKSGVAELDANGRVPTAQLPSYVDDVIEGYLSSGIFYNEVGHTTQITGETGKIYVDIPTNVTYRWSGSGYTEISKSLALGETSSTAYYGDKGKTAYDHSQKAHAPSDAEKNVIVGIQTNGIDVATDTSRKVNIKVPTKTSDLVNDSNFKTTDNNTTYDLAATKSSANESVKINLTGNDSTTDSIAIKGSGSTVVTTDSSGVIDVHTETSGSAETVPWGGVTGKPNTYPPDTHTHKPADVGLGNVPNVTTNNQTPTFTEAVSRANITGSGETLSIILGKIKRFFTDLKTVAFTGSYTDLSYKPTIPTVPQSLKNPFALTVKQNGANAKTYDGSVAQTVDITASGIGAPVIKKISKEELDNPVLPAGIYDIEGEDIGTGQGNYHYVVSLTNMHVQTPGGYGIQVAFPYMGGTTHGMWVRGCAGTSATKWTSWTEFYGAANLPTSLKGLTATIAELNYTDGVKSNIQTQLDGKAATHTHPYAGSASQGGSANSAVKLDTSAGSATQPVYFTDGKPAATMYKLNADVPTGAKFTDTNTTYDLAAPASATNGNVKLNLTDSNKGTDSVTIKGTGATSVTTDSTGAIVVNSTDNNTTYVDATTTQHGLMSIADKSKLSGIASGAEVNVINSVKVNGTALTPSSKAVNVSITGSGATKVNTDASGNITISSTDTNTTYGAAGANLGLVKSGGDVTISNGQITVNGKAPTSHASSNTTYGTGNSSNYGHVKLSDSVSTTSASSGVAATPKAVFDAIQGTYANPIRVTPEELDKTWKPGIYVCYFDPRNSGCAYDCIIEVMNWQDSDENFILTQKIITSSDPSSAIELSVTYCREAYSFEAINYSDILNQTTYRDWERATLSLRESKARTRSSTIVVAAADSVSESRLAADYVCGSSSAQTIIQTAINALPATGGKVVLLEGTYNISGSININKPNVTIEGMGMGATILKTSSTAVGQIINANSPKCSVRHLTLKGTSKKASGIAVATTDAIECVFEDIEGCDLWAVINDTSPGTLTDDTIDRKTRIINLYAHDVNIGVQIWQSVGTFVSGCTIRDFDEAGIAFYGYRIKINNNYVINGKGTASDYSASTYTIWCRYTSKDCDILNNYILGKNYTSSGGSSNTFANNKY